MYASEAREITVAALNDSIAEYMEDVFEGIKRSAESGDSYYNFYIDRNKQSDIDRIDSRLKELKYTTEVIGGTDYYRAYIKIMW